MTEIIVKELDSSTYQVSVQAQSTTVHIVTVRSEYVSSLLKPNESVPNLVKRSFEFLLRRESNTSILRSFDLSVIGRYFPEYEREIRK
jgi:hypothetical protein